MLILICFAWLTCKVRAVELQKLDILVFTLLTMVCLKLARVELFLGLLAHFALVWFGCFGSLICFCLLCCAMLAYFALLARFNLFCFTCLVCFAM